MTDFKKERKEKSELDYFSAFMTLWLGYNSWYKSHYSDMINSSDRQFINKLKTDISGRNQTYTNFSNLLTTIDRKSLEFKTNFELLIIQLNRCNLLATKEDIRHKKLSFEKALLDYDQRTQESAYINLVKSFKQSKKRNKIKLNAVEIINDLALIFAGTIEIIYQIRCLLFHGQMEPTEDNKNVIKYAYLTLYQLME